MYTEDEARKKWCPQSFAPFSPRGWVSDAMGGASWPDKPAGFSCRCIASECMAWRWAGDYKFKDVPNGTKPPKGWVKAGLSGIGYARYRAPMIKGCCGLAGKP